MDFKDTQSLLRTKRDHMAQQQIKEYRNKIFQANRKKAMEKQIFDIQNVQAMFITNLNGALQILMQLEDEMKDEMTRSMLFHWGVLDDLIQQLFNYKQLEENQLKTILQLINSISQDYDTGLYLINTKTIHLLEIILATHNNITILEYCMYIIGNLDNYNANEYFTKNVLPRLFQFLINFEPLPVQCLCTFSWMIFNLKVLNQEQIQMELLQLENDEIILEAVQKIEIIDINQNMMHNLIQKVDLITDPHQLQPQLLLNFICKNLTQSNAIPELVGLLDKCLQSGKLLVLKSAYKLAQNYIIQTQKPYYNAIVDQRTTQLLICKQALQEIMHYLETFHLYFTDSKFSVHFYSVFMDTLTLNHLRLLSILLVIDSEYIKQIANHSSHKQQLQKLCTYSDNARELIKKLYL